MAKKGMTAAEAEWMNGERAAWQKAEAVRESAIAVYRAEMLLVNAAFEAATGKTFKNR